MAWEREGSADPPEIAKRRYVQGEISRDEAAKPKAKLLA
jgi:uncharacterized membrane protein